MQNSNFKIENRLHAFFANRKEQRFRFFNISAFHFHSSSSYPFFIIFNLKKNQLSIKLLFIFQIKIYIRLSKMPLLKISNNYSGFFFNIGYFGNLKFRPSYIWLVNIFSFALNADSSIKVTPRTCHGKITGGGLRVLKGQDVYKCASVIATNINQYEIFKNYENLCQFEEYEKKRAIRCLADFRERIWLMCRNWRRYVQ